MFYFELLESMETGSNHNNAKDKAVEVMDDIDFLIKGTIESAKMGKNGWNKMNNSSDLLTGKPQSMVYKVVGNKCYIVGSTRQRGLSGGQERKGSAKFREYTISPYDKNSGFPKERDMQIGSDHPNVSGYADITYLEDEEQYEAAVFRKNSAGIMQRISADHEKSKAFFQNFPR